MTPSAGKAEPCFWRQIDDLVTLPTRRERGSLKHASEAKLPFAGSRGLAKAQGGNACLNCPKS